MTTKYGDISPRTAAYVVKELLTRGAPLLVFELFGQAKPLPMNSSKAIKFRRYYMDGSDLSSFTPQTYYDSNNMDPTQKVLTEGVTPTPTSINYEDISATLVQYGDLIQISDVISDTHEDRILNECIDMLSEQAPVLLEKARFNVLKAGTNVAYANGSARSSVNSVFAVGDQRTAVRALKRQLARMITRVVGSTPDYGTESVAGGFISVCHTDLEYDIRSSTGFIPAENYHQTKPFEGEIGKISDVRYILTTIAEPWTEVGAAGATGGDNVIENANNEAHVYPILYLAKDAYGLVPLKGKKAIMPMVSNAKVSPSDPLAQRSYISWKAYQTTVILSEPWMYRLEVACTDSLT